MILEFFFFRIYELPNHFNDQRSAYLKDKNQYCSTAFLPKSQNLGQLQNLNQNSYL
jgi:hypothetical protein